MRRRVDRLCENREKRSDFVYSDAQRYDETTERYRESLAAIDRRLAAACDVVAEVAAGNPRLYKGALPL